MKSERTVKTSLDAQGRLTRDGRVVRARVSKGRLESPAAFAPDDDAPTLTAREIATFRRVKPSESVDPLNVRTRLKMSQAAFAHVFGVSVRTVQEWEQRRRQPTGAARALLQVIDREPDAVRRAIGLQ